MPICIFVKFKTATWQIGDLEPGVYPLKPRSKTWLVHETLKVKAKRFGFQLVPDLAWTAHMYQGDTLPAAIVNLLEVDHRPQMSDATAAYVESSRVKLKETIIVTEPFSPALFCLGANPGPKLPLQVLRGEPAPAPEVLAARAVAPRLVVALLAAARRVPSERSRAVRSPH